MRQLRMAGAGLLALALAACAGEVPPRADGPGPAGRWRWERVPITEVVEVPTCERKAVPTQAIRFVPQYEVVDEEVWVNKRVPLQQEVCDPLTGQTRLTTYGHTWTRVPGGTRKRQVFKGYEPEARDTGFCTWESEETGSETRTEIKGWRWAQVPVDGCAPTSPAPSSPTGAPSPENAKNQSKD